MKPMLAPSVAASAGRSGSTPAACATAIATGTIMFADAVFEVASDSTIATPVKTIVNASSVCTGSNEVSAVADPARQAGRKRQIAQRQPAAIEQDDAPVDARRPGPR